MLGAVAVIVATAPGCGFGSGESSPGTAELVVTRDHGHERLLAVGVEDPPASETVARVLDREATIETSFGGNFVDAIDGLRGSAGSGGRSDWFFYVNGYWSPIGAAEAGVEPGDRIWWDYRRWDAAYRVPVVVGSWPAPFDVGPVRLLCRAPVRICDPARTRIARSGVEICAGFAERPNDPGARGCEGRTARILIGAWSRIRHDLDAATLANGPATSGVYVKVNAEGSFEPLGEDGELAAGAPAVDALVAAVRPGDDPATLVVTATSSDALGGAIDSLDEAHLADRYAVAITADGERFGLPVLAR